MEVSAIRLITSLLPRYPTLRTHIVHLSAADALPLVSSAKAQGARLSAETCFHYLSLEAGFDGGSIASNDDGAVRIPDRAPQFKCCPPVRSGSNRSALWSALRDGTLDMVVSDHSPCTPDLKHLDAGDVMSAWGGISGLGLGLSLLWSTARARGIGMRDVLRWTAEAPAKHASLDGRKGALAPGLDADLCFFDPDVEFTVRLTIEDRTRATDQLLMCQVTKETLQFKNKLSAYEGRRLRGRVEQTYVRGRLVYNRALGQDGFQGLAPCGDLL
jgi:allantoinase